MIFVPSGKTVPLASPLPELGIAFADSHVISVLHPSPSKGAIPDICLEQLSTSVLIVKLGGQTRSGVPSTIMIFISWATDILLQAVTVYSTICVPTLSIDPGSGPSV